MFGQKCNYQNPLKKIRENIQVLIWEVYISFPAPFLCVRDLIKMVKGRTCTLSPRAFPFLLVVVVVGGGGTAEVYEPLTS